MTADKPFILERDEEADPALARIAITHHQWRTEASADKQVGKAAEGDREREGAAELRQHRLHGFLRRFTCLDLFADQMRDDFGVGLALEGPPACLQRFA